MEKIKVYLEIIGNIENSISVAEEKERVIAKLEVIDKLCDMCDSEIYDMQSRYLTFKKEFQKPDVVE